MFTNNFDPVAFNILSLEFRWYSLAYIAGILIGWVYCKKKFILYSMPPLKRLEVNHNLYIQSLQFLDIFLWGI